MNYDGGLDYEYAKTLPAVEIDILTEVINEQRKAEEQAIQAARSKGR